MASTKKLIEIAKKGDTNQLNKMLEDEKIRALKRALRTAMRDDDFEAMAAIQTVIDQMEPKATQTRRHDADAILVTVTRQDGASDAIFEMVTFKGSRKGKVIRKNKNAVTFAIKDQERADKYIQSVNGSKLKGISAKKEK